MDTNLVIHRFSQNALASGQARVCKHCISSHLRAVSHCCVLRTSFERREVTVRTSLSLAPSFKFPICTEASGNVFEQTLCIYVLELLKRWAPSQADREVWSVTARFGRLADAAGHPTHLCGIIERLLRIDAILSQTTTMTGFFAYLVACFGEAPVNGPQYATRTPVNAFGLE
ncbi:hypothetical protein DFH06DRAFT_1152028 [Mycena polygramma]|nr:hypothetical protein DFH06DRAFT_1152028 [Mycena polygramma]